MTQILYSPYLDYADVLITPKMGYNLNSRKDVELSREYKFKHGQVRSGLGVFNANMATVGNFKIAKQLLKAGMFATLHKFYTPEEIVDFVEECLDKHISVDNLFITIGVKNGKNEVEKLRKITLLALKSKWKSLHLPTNICIDAPNFYIPKAYETLKACREAYPQSVIMCGNIASSDICHKLLEYADILKIGIGPGCFHGSMKVHTKEGDKEIKKVKIGDYVLSHSGNYNKVIDKFVFLHHKKYIKINNIECTPDHKFLVCNKKDKNKINENNYMKMCFWMEAELLNKDEHYIIKIEE